MKFEKFSVIAEILVLENLRIKNQKIKISKKLSLKTLFKNFKINLNNIR